ncbi:SWIB-domain-containing protein [Suhomyces tanzawaensis NRRL Y-17324]|uniref:SWIB-domain-containing protein n=1 Tax=Suhomyces tanzawaensis NRRL Y-17324 TaxID=984487 RepID=A0A1E4SJ38_9ASCO|nr:SWIB-domain-containing protein [Suhomyces tanzawaensis NRRL Y-17324]ODV79452.1 SWIB-domain-containing protein [Suhomyces tanzawaensis NRRL Y-17324]
MSETYSPEKYLPTIDAILGVADLEQITVKKIRNALQELFGVDLLDHKKEINEFILARYYDLIDRRTEEEKSEKERKEEIEKLDALLAARLLKSEVSGPLMRARRQNRVVKKARGTGQSTANNAGFNREMVLSPELLVVVGLSKMSRPQVVKAMWAYIKANDLQNPDDKRQIECDYLLQGVFKKKTVGAFEMNKILNKHIFKPEEVLSNGVKKEATYESDEDSG